MTKLDMPKADNFDLTHFLPYLMTQAADKISLEFRDCYKKKYGMLRTEWRVLFHLGSYGELTAKQICDRANMHKTKVSRAVAALEAKRYLTRHEHENDRRHEGLKLTKQGEKVFIDLRAQAMSFDEKIKRQFSKEQMNTLQNCLIDILKRS